MEYLSPTCPDRGFPLILDFLKGNRAEMRQIHIKFPLKPLLHFPTSSSCSLYDTTPVSSVLHRGPIKGNSVPLNTHLQLCSLFSPLPQGYNSTLPDSPAITSSVPDVSTYSWGQSWSTAGSMTATKKPFTILTAGTDFAAESRQICGSNSLSFCRGGKTTRLGKHRGKNSSIGTIVAP